MTDILEKLAELEHKQWIKWTQTVSEYPECSMSLTKKWAGNWKPYSQLSEEEKEKDREWARKVLDIMIEWWDDFNK